MSTLDQVFSARANALTAMRLGAALLVACGHAYEIGGFGPDPLRAATGVTMGELGVNIFFSLSGFLVARSWTNAPSVPVYLTKRALRIFPGLWFCLLLTAFVLFPWLRQHLDTARESPVAGLEESLEYVWHNALLKVRQSTFGTLFTAQPAAGVANGSLWSLLPEALCYLGVLLLALLGTFRGRRGWLALAAALILTISQAAAPLLVNNISGTGRWWWVWRLATEAAFFASGVALHVHAAGISASSRTLLLCLLALGGALAGGLYFWIAPLVLPLALLILATRIPAQNWERWGDYSYGIYLYHFSLQQTLVALGFVFGGPIRLFLAGLIIAAPLAALSWWGVERPALRWKPSRLKAG